MWHIEIMHAGRFQESIIDPVPSFDRALEIIDALEEMGGYARAVFRPVAGG